mmetsp:Transcript_14995/g.30194  ORF Transcript_14995/g.30194 Transcript_14995/m.30194 type:complete len:258 (+) Transcript_14995:57-830(+)
MGPSLQQWSSRQTEREAAASIQVPSEHWLLLRVPHGLHRWLLHFRLDSRLHTWYRHRLHLLARAHHGHRLRLVHVRLSHGRRHDAPLERSAHGGRTRRLRVASLVTLVGVGEGVGEDRLEAVLRHVKACVLDLLVDAHADGLVDGEEEQPRRGNSPQHDADAPNNLDSELLAAPARVVDIGVGGVLHVLVGAEDAGGPKAPHPAETVHDARVAGVVDLEDQQEVVPANQNAGADDTNQERHPRVHHRTVGSDRDQTS